MFKIRNVVNIEQEDDPESLKTLFLLFAKYFSSAKIIYFFFYKRLIIVINVLEDNKK